MDKVSTYTLCGIPEGVSTALVLISLSLTLTPWLGGTELGPLKIPQLAAGTIRWLRLIAPLTFLLVLLGFFKLWPSAQGTSSSASTAHSQQGTLVTLGELENEQLRTDFGLSRWEGGPHWGQISFDQTGRIATYTNEPGRSPGRILLQGEAEGTAPLIVGEWHQEDGQGGGLYVALAFRDVELVRHKNAPHTLHVLTNTLEVLWGPDHAVTSTWKRESGPVVR